MLADEIVLGAGVVLLLVGFRRRGLLVVLRRAVLGDYTDLGD